MSPGPLLITFANSLDPYQARKNVGPDLDSISRQKKHEQLLRGKALREKMKLNLTFEPRHEISNNVVRASSKGSDQPAHTRSLIRAFAGRLNIL